MVEYWYLLSSLFAVVIEKQQSEDTIPSSHLSVLRYGHSNIDIFMFIYYNYIQSPSDIVKESLKCLRVIRNRNSKEKTLQSPNEKGQNGKL